MSSIQLATWNVNSLKVRLPHVIDWLQAHPIDVLCLQETKLIDADFPKETFQELGYNAVYSGQKTYNGVAILTKEKSQLTCSDLITDLPDFVDPQRRIMSLVINDIRVINAYFPNGQAPGTDKFAYKLEWLTALTTWLTSELKKNPYVVLLGDFNIAPEDRDVRYPEQWEGQNLVSPEERLAFQTLEALGLKDAFRLFDQAEKIYSWWDYRMMAFRRNAGLRIDHILVSEKLAQQCTECFIDKVPRSWERPSDHAPVVASFLRA